MFDFFTFSRPEAQPLDSDMSNRRQKHVKIVPHVAPRLGRIFPITEMHKSTETTRPKTRTAAPYSERRLFTGFAIPALAAKPATVTHAMPAMLTPASANTHHPRWMRK
jgi:hypothetical protein